MLADIQMDIASIALSLDNSAFSRTSSNSSITACMIGIIIAVVAVFEIHMDRKAVGKMNPSISSLGEVPISFMALKKQSWINQFES